MTPDAKDLCVFAVKRGDMKNRLDINYNLPQYTMLEEKLYQTFGENLKRISDIADVICGPFGSAIKNTDYQDSGIPLVRITNINKDGYMNYDDLIYISEKLGDSLSKTQVSNGDIVVSQRGSLGQCAIVDDSFPKMNISANIIAIKNINGVSVSFLHDYFLSTVGQTLLERSVSGQVQSKITTQDIADLLIPVNTDETKLTDLLDSAYKSYKRKLQQADKLQRKNPTYLIERLGLTSDYSETQKLTYATTAGSIEGRIDADYYSPKFSHFRSQIEALPYDDPVLPDFGEIKLNYRSKYYSVITGTGHTAPIFSALQFLEKISESACMDAYTDSLLCYSDYCIDFLKAKNTPINEDFSLHPQFESPTFDYYENVKDFMTEEKWTGLGTPLLSMLAAESNEIVRSHFFSYNDHYYPLFNPSLVIDYQTKILLTRPDRELHSIVISSLADKLASIYDSHDIKTDYTIRKPLLLDNKQPLLDNKKSFAYLEDSNLIVFLDCGNEHRIEEEISAIYKAHTEDGLSIVDLEARIPGKGYKAYHVDKECKLSIICFDEHINVDQPRIVLRGREEKRIYTAIDLMYMLMFSSEVSQIAEFDSDEKNSESQVLSWGGASDYFTVFLSEKGFISKGAIEYSNVYSEVDTSAAHIFSHYLELGGVFPFHLSSTIFADPECWNVICDDNSVYQFTRKVKALPGGALFKYDNGCSVFLSYNFFSILKESNITQSRLSLDMFRAVTEKFFIEYHQDLSAIPPLANTLVQFCCHSLSNQNPEHYVCCQKAKVSSNKLVVDFEVNSSKIASDIAEAIDRSVEYSVIGELLQPLVCLSKDSYSELFEKMELTSGQKKTLGTTAVRIDYYFNPDTYEIKETDVSELSIRKQIAKICAAAGVLPGTYERRDATEIVRKIQESVVSHLEQAIRTLERDRLHILLLSALATEQLSVNLNRTGATLTEDIEEGERIKSLEKSTQLSEKAKMRKSALLYLIETNLYLVNERKEEAIDSSKLSELLSFAKWIIYLQNSSDLCFHTDSDTKLIVEDDYRIDVELGENYSQTFEKESQRRIIAEPFNLRGDNTDRDFFEKVANAFYEDLGVHFKVLESVLHHLSDSSFSHDNVEFDEIAPNVIKAKATDVLNDYLSFVVENVPVEDVKSAYDFLTIVPGQLKTICDTTHPILPIWEREKRNHCFAVRPIYMSNNDYIYSPIIMEEVRKRWIEGFLQFYPPFEIGLERTCTALYAWKNSYEHLFSSEVEVLLKESGCEYAKHDVDLRREDRRGNHPTIDVLGDYDVIGLNTTQKRIFIIECKVLQPIGSVFEHSNQQKRFFTKEKFDEKFQKRIDYFSKVAMSFFANHGYDTEGFTINPYMVVNKVFSSYYKHVQFPIVTFDELKREIQL